MSRQKKPSVYSFLMRSGDSHTSTANSTSDPALFNPRWPRLKNIVVREVRDRDGIILGRVIEPHDGTPEGVIAAAQAAADRMYAEFDTASNGESRICATDATGNPRREAPPKHPDRKTNEAHDPRHDNGAATRRTLNLCVWIADPGAAKNSSSLSISTAKYLLAKSMSGTRCSSNSLTRSTELRAPSLGSSQISHGSTLPYKAAR